MTKSTIDLPIQKIILLLLLTVSCSLPVMADKETDSLRQAVKAAQDSRDIEQEIVARERLMVSFYNRLLYDSLIVEAYPQMKFYSGQQDWEHYYYVWRMLVSAYIYSGKNNTALREVKKMYADAQQRDNDEGIALSSHVMGISYFNMGYYDEARKSFERALAMMEGKPNEAFMLVGLYGDYCELLSAQKDYAGLKTATDGWWKALMQWGRGRGMKDEETAETVFATFCYVAKARAERGLENYDAAEELLTKATHNAKLYGEDSDDGYWHHVAGELASLYYAKDNYALALHFNDEVLKWAKIRNVDNELTGAEEQRAEILIELGHYKEAAALLTKANKAIKERNLQDAKDQLNEMNTLFQVDEMAMQQQEEKTRYTIIIASLIVAALLIFLIFRYQAAKHLAQKNAQLAVALERAQESDKIKSSFIRHVSHEIRTPLNIITGFTQVLNDSHYTVDEKERDNMMARISENTSLITQIVNELIDLAETESTSVIEKTDHTTVGNLCQLAVARSGIEPTDKVEFILLNNVDNAFPVVTNTQCVVKILGHLLQNAMKFTEKGSITLKTTANDDQTKLSFYVIDTGIGIPPEAQSRIFDKFEKVDTFREGIGLGLSVARTLARRLGGDVTLSRSDSEGSTFVLTIPTAS